VKFVVQEQDSQYEFLLSPGLYIVGRDPTCDLTLQSRRVSRRHMSCTVTRESVKIKDMGSRNRTYVGGVPVQEAVLKDGDEVTLGDVRLVFRAGAAVPVCGEPAAQAVAPEPRVEDEESTPEQGSLPARQGPAGGPQLVERDGRWFVTDPRTGRQVEIVPVERGAAAPARRPLWGTTRGRVGLAAGALLVAALLAVGLLRGRRPASEEDSAAAMGRYVDAALDALNRGDTELAKKVAQQALALAPDSETARAIGELAELWDPWRENFFAHYRQVERALENLYQHHASHTVDEFRREYSAWIERELEYSRRANLARRAHQEGRFEAAWLELKDIPEGSPVRERDAELFADVRAALHGYLEGGMRTAALRQNWAEAGQYARKLCEYFPEAKEKTAALLRLYRQYEGHAELMRKAKAALAQQNFEEAELALRAVPPDSPYHAEAARLIQRARAGGQYARALALYNQGDAAGALKELSSLQSDAAGALARHVRAVTDQRKAAIVAQQQGDLLEAEQRWQALAEMETDAQNYYRKEALRALEEMPRLRRDQARKLGEQAARAYQQGRWAEARQLYEKAAAVDPEARIGVAELRRLSSEGEWDYRRALNLRDTDPEAALRLFSKACALLPQEHKYHAWAAREKAKLEQRLNKQ